MEFAYKNYIQTTTSITVDSNTSLVGNLLNWKLEKQYYSDGYDNDTTTTSITLSFDETQTVNRIALLEHNLKSYTLFYDGLTANTFTIENGDTTTSNYSSNSASSQYLKLTSVNCTSVSIDMKSTTTADQEKALGYFLASRQLLNFERIPSAKDYNITKGRKDIVHNMSDGGTKIHVIDYKWSTDIKWRFVSTTFRDNLKTVFDLRDSFVFVPFGTTTSWDKIIFESDWVNDFQFYRYADNYVDAGYTGQISLREI